MLQEINTDNLGSIVDGLDLENELFGTTTDDDGLDINALPGSTPIVEDEGDAPTVDPDNTPAAPVVASTSKSSIAKGLFVAKYDVVAKALKPGFARKDVIKDFETIAGLTAKGAATYYQNYTRDVKNGKFKL